nr:hypothetical protein [Cronobacter sakazakii]
MKGAENLNLLKDIANNDKKTADPKDVATLGTTSPSVVRVLIIDDIKKHKVGDAINMIAKKQFRILRWLASLQPSRYSKENVAASNARRTK